MNASPATAALAIGAGLGLIISYVLLRMRVLPLSFEQGGPELDVDKQRRAEQEREGDRRPASAAVDYESPEVLPPEYSPAEIRREIRKEMLFLMPPLALGGLFVLLSMKVAPIAGVWVPFLRAHDWMSGFCGALLGGLVGGFVIWLARIVFSIAFGKEAMGLGDIDLMFAIGAVLGPGAAVVTFFISPFAAIGVSIYRLAMRKSHQIPFGPYLSLAAAATMLFYCPIAAYFTPGLTFIGGRLRELMGM